MEGEGGVLTDAPVVLLYLVLGGSFEIFCDVDRYHSVINIVENFEHNAIEPPRCTRTGALERVVRAFPEESLTFACVGAAVFAVVEGRSLNC